MEWLKIRAQLIETKSYTSVQYDLTRQMSGFGGKADMTFCGANVAF
jgi:hypothetical protein